MGEALGGGTRWGRRVEGVLIQVVNPIFARRRAPLEEADLAEAGVADGIFAGGRGTEHGFLSASSFRPSSANCAGIWWVTRPIAVEDGRERPDGPNPPYSGIFRPGLNKIECFSRASRNVPSSNRPRGRR